jgi:hypothetical protein
MIQAAHQNAELFRLGRRAYKRIGTLGWLLFNAFLICAFICAVLGAWLLTTYSHAFTPYLKWQDALVALCWWMSLISLGGCVLVARFLHALHAGYREAMLTFIGNETLIVRDLSPENLASICWIAGIALVCFLAALLGLVPLMLLGWTLHLPHLILAVPITALVIVLSVAGLLVSAIIMICIIMSCIGCISFCRKLAAPQTYQLNAQTTLTINSHEGIDIPSHDKPRSYISGINLGARGGRDPSGSYVLTIISSNKPESLINLNLFDEDDQRQLLYLLCKLEIEWNLTLDQEI